MPTLFVCPLTGDKVLRPIPLKIVLIRDTFSEMADLMPFLRLLPADVADRIATELSWQQEFGPPSEAAHKLIDSI